MISNGNTTNKDSSENNQNRGKGNPSRKNNNTKNAGDTNAAKASNKNNPKNSSQGRTTNKNTGSPSKNEGKPPRGNRNYYAKRNNSSAKNASSNHHNGSLSGHEIPTVSERFATKVSKAAGSTPAFICAFLIVIGWAICGPIFNFSETWQLFINTGTTIITFLMVFLIQKAQNKDSLAIQLKLNELVASHAYSSNRLVDIENMTEEEMIVVQKYYRSLSELSKKDEKLQTSHSIEEAEERHAQKSSKRNRGNKPRNLE